MKKIDLILNSLLIVFVITLGALILNLVDPSIEIPFGNSQDVNSPSNWIDETQINIYSNQVVLNIENPRFVGFEDTNSMDPVFDIEANVIEVMPESSDDINVGDIISFELENGQIYIHRVVAKDYDKSGVYFITKGDNNPNADPILVRWSQIIGVVVAIFY